MEPDLHDTDPRLLAQILATDDVPRRLWPAEELGAILRHQLATSVQMDLESGGSKFQARLAALPAAQQPGNLTYEGVFQLASPPLELLSLIKQLAKSSRVRGESVLPPEIATVIYLAAIVTARLRLGRRITEQSDESLLHGIQWVLDQRWVNETTHALFRDAKAHYARMG
jgi:hypothetical protein